MPTNDDVDARADAAPAPTNTNPSFSLGDISAFADTFADRLVGKLREAMPHQAPAPANDPEPEGINQEEYDSLSAPQRALIDKAIRKGVHGVQRELKELREVGLSRIADLTAQAAATNLPYYKEFRTEIEAELANVAPALRADPRTIEIVHNNVAMRHMGTILDRTRNEALNEARGDAPLPSGVSGRAAGGPKGAAENSVPTPEDLGFSEDQLAEVERKGGPDNFAVRVSDGRIPDWKTYTEKYALYKGAARTGRGRFIPFRKGTPLKPAEMSAVLGARVGAK